jgi:hypothetical protein
VLAASIIALMMKAASTSETSANFHQTSRRNHPEDSQLQMEHLFQNNGCFDLYLGDPRQFHSCHNLFLVSLLFKLLPRFDDKWISLAGLSISWNEKGLNCSSGPTERKTLHKGALAAH